MTQSLTSRLLRRLGHADVFGHGREDEEDEGGDGGDEDEEPEEERVEHARHLLPLVDGDPLGLGPLVGLQHRPQVVQWGCSTALKYALALSTSEWFALVGGLGLNGCLLYTSPSPRDISGSRMPSSA